MKAGRLGDAETVQAYKSLARVERALRSTMDVIEMSTHEAWPVLESVNLVEFRLQEGRPKAGVAVNHPQARRILDGAHHPAEEPAGSQDGETTVN